MPYFPTRQWLAEYARLLDASECLDAVAAGWGVGFDGSVLLVIDDLPVAATTVAELPAPLRAELPDAVLASVAELSLADAAATLDGEARAGLPDTVADLLDQIDHHVDDGTVRSYVTLEEGRVADATLLAADERRDPGFVVRGTYPTWRQIVDGRPALSAVVQGDLAVRGNPVRVAQYAAVFQQFGDVAAEVETTHLFDGASPSATDAVLDGALRGPITVQHEFQRRAASLSRRLGFL